MTKPDFSEMGRKELRAYVLKHRDDEEAFRVFADKLVAEAPKGFYPPLKSIDDLQNFPEVIERFRQEGENLQRKNEED